MASSLVFIARILPDISSPHDVTHRYRRRRRPRWTGAARGGDIATEAVRSLPRRPRRGCEARRLDDGGAGTAPTILRR